MSRRNGACFAGPNPASVATRSDAPAPALNVPPTQRRTSGLAAAGGSRHHRARSRLPAFPIDSTRYLLSAVARRPSKAAAVVELMSGVQMSALAAIGTLRCAEPSASEAGL